MKKTFACAIRPNKALSMRRGLSIIGLEHSYGLNGSRIFDPTQMATLGIVRHPSEKGAVESETIQLRLKWGGWQSSQSANPVVGLAGSGCRLPFPHLPPVTTSCVISQIRQLSGGLVTHLTQLLRYQLFRQSYVLSFLILKIKLLIYQLGILALCLLVKHCQNLK